MSSFCKVKLLKIFYLFEFLSFFYGSKANLDFFNKKGKKVADCYFILSTAKTFRWKGKNSLISNSIRDENINHIAGCALFMSGFFYSYRGHQTEIRALSLSLSFLWPLILDWSNNATSSITTKQWKICD